MQGDPHGFQRGGDVTFTIIPALPLLLLTKCYQIITPAAFEEVNLLVPCEAHTDLRLLFVPQCGLYHRLMRSFSLGFCFLEGTYD